MNQSSPPSNGSSMNSCPPAVVVDNVKSYHDDQQRESANDDDDLLSLLYHGTLGFNNHQSSGGKGGSGRHYCQVHVCEVLKSLADIPINYCVGFEGPVASRDFSDGELGNDELEKGLTEEEKATANAVVEEKTAELKAHVAGVMKAAKNKLKAPVQAGRSRFERPSDRRRRLGFSALGDDEHRIRLAAAKKVRDLIVKTPSGLLLASKIGALGGQEVKDAVKAWTEFQGLKSKSKISRWIKESEECKELGMWSDFFVKCLLHSHITLFLNINVNVFLLFEIASRTGARMVLGLCLQTC